MKQNDRRNKKISEICRILANACMSENTSLYLEDVMTFVNESRNSDIKELLALHMALNEIDAIKRLDKSLECAEAWHYYTRPLRVRRPRGLNTFDECSKHLGYDDSWNRFDEDYDKALLEASFEGSNMESEIAEYEEYIAYTNSCYTWLYESDNDIAVETNNAIKVAEAKRRRQMADIAATAVKEDVNIYAIVKFLNTMCRDDDEQAVFLDYYVSAKYDKGYYKGYCDRYRLHN